MASEKSKLLDQVPAVLRTKLFHSFHGISYCFVLACYIWALERFSFILISVFLACFGLFR